MIPGSTKAIFHQTNLKMLFLYRYLFKQIDVAKRTAINLYQLAQ